MDINIYFDGASVEINDVEINNNKAAYPRMETSRLVLRALQMEDADFILKEWGDEVVTHFMRAARVLLPGWHL